MRHPRLPSPFLNSAARSFTSCSHSICAVGLLLWFSSICEGLRAGDFQIPNINANAQKVLIAAHRGGYETDKDDEAPENSVAAVEVAIQKGYDVFETDIQRTSDGVFVIVHDPTIDRETTGSGKAEDLTLLDLKALKKRYRDGTVSNESVATLEELLLAGKGRILFKPDLKPGVIEHFDALARLIVELEMQDQVFVRTAYRDAGAIHELFESGTPKIEVMFKVSNTTQVQRLQQDFQPKTIEVNVGEDLPLSATEKETIAAACELGILVETHSYKTPELWEELAKSGVRMFHTTKPQETLRYLETNGWRERSDGE